MTWKQCATLAAILATLHEFFDGKLNDITSNNASFAPQSMLDKINDCFKEVIRWIK